MNKTAFRRSVIALVVTLTAVGGITGIALAARDSDEVQSGTSTVQQDETVAPSGPGSYPIHDSSPFIHGQRPGEVKRP